jgi:hypothetical protein
MTPLKSAPAIVVATLLFAGCDARVSESEEGKDQDVDVRSPIGNLTVRTSVGVLDTGLAVYPGATLMRDDEDDGDSADVNISSPFFDLRVMAAEYSSDAEPQKLIEFYRNEMKRYGEVTECRGNIDFKGGDNPKKPVCKSNGSSEVQLVTGHEENHRLVVVKPRGTGSEFAMVYIDTRERV